MIANRAGYTLYDSGTVASGAVITSSTIDATLASELLIIVNNASGANTRALTMDILTEDGLTTLKSALALRTVGTSATELLVVANAALATVVTAVIAMPIPPKFVISLAAAGSSNGRVTIFGR